MLLKDICTLDVACCGPETTALEAARIMRRQHSGDLVVIDDTEGERTPVGIVTDRDLVVEILGHDLDPATTAVGTILRTPVVIAHETEDATQALERMRAHGVRRIPVVGSANQLIGIVTLDDLLKILAAAANSLVDIVAREQGREQRSRR